MSIVKKRLCQIAVAAFMVTCMISEEAKAQSGTRGGYSSPAMSAPMSSAPSYSAPSYSAPTYSAPAYSAPTYSTPSQSYQSAQGYSGAPIAVGSGCSGPGCSGSVISSASPVITSSPQYQTYSSQPVYSSAYRGYPQATTSQRYYSNFAPVVRYRTSHCTSGNCR